VVRDRRSPLLLMAVSTVLLASCQPGSVDEDESQDVASLATATPGETESLVANQVPDDVDDRQFSPTITVSEQESDGRTVVVDRVEFATPKGLGSEGWLVISADDEGRPGDVLGHVKMPATGFDSSVEVTLDEPLQPEGGVREVQLWATVHRDGSPDGEFQWPGNDRPLVRGEGGVLAEDFGVTVTGDTDVATTPG
jgi:hypothetical protein